LAFGLVYSQDATTHAPHHHVSHAPRPLRHVVCYMAGWARYRPDPVQFVPEDIDTSLCTHIIFAFALLDKTGLQIVQADPPVDEELYRRVVSLKREKRGLKVLLSVGGWTAGSTEFTKTVSSKANMNAFALNAVAFLRRYGFDGLDVDWEYPGDRGSPAADKERFTGLLKILRAAFKHDQHVTNRPPLMLSAAIGVAPSRLTQSYELPDIGNFTDMINVMAYDLHGSWDSTTGHHSPLYSPSNDETDSVDYMMSNLLKTGINPMKINLGLSLYGTAFNLSDPANHALGAPVQGKGQAGPYLHAKGTLAYYEVCKLLTEANDTITDQGRLPGTSAPYVVDGSRWTGYDDAVSIKEKVMYADQHNLGGVFVWSIDLDDFHGVCGQGHYPLMHAIADGHHASGHAHHTPAPGGGIVGR